MISRTLRSIVFLMILSIPSLANNSITIQPELSGNQIRVELQLTNSDTLSGMQIPLDLGLNKLGLRVDSVSFAGSRIEHFFENFYTENPDSDQIFIFILESANPEIESTPLLPGSGKIATIYLTRVSTPEVDDHTIKPREIQDRHRRLIFNAWNPRGEAVDVEFTPMRLDVRRE